MRRGALLLEAMLALTIFVAAGMTILSMVNQSADAIMASRQKQKAADLARSAMAMLEAGIESPTALNGPVPAWRDDEEAAGAFEDSPPPPTGWELSIKTEAWPQGDLTMVEVTALKRNPTGDQTGPSFTLRQLVRFSPEERKGIGNTDAIEGEGNRGQPPAKPILKPGGKKK